MRWRTQTELSDDPVTALDAVVLAALAFAAAALDGFFRLLGERALLVLHRWIVAFVGHKRCFSRLMSILRGIVAAGLLGHSALTHTAGRKGRQGIGVDGKYEPPPEPNWNRYTVDSRAAPVAALLKLIF